MNLRSLAILGAALLASGELVAQPSAVERLAKSSRHHEYVDIGSGPDGVRAFVVYPESSGKAPVALGVLDRLR